MYILLYLTFHHQPQPLNHPLTMSSTFQTPLRPDPVQTPIHPYRSRSRYYARRVQESLTSRFAKFICTIVIFLVLIAGLIIFILWLSLRPHRPRFYLHSFKLNQPGSPISFNVSDRNPNRKIAIYYDSMNGSVYYFDQIVGSGLVQSAFYQPPKHTTLIQGQIGSNAKGPALGQIVGNGSTGSAQLRFELESTIRFKVTTWDTRRHRLHVSCEFGVGSDGNLLPAYVDERCPIYF